MEDEGIIELLFERKEAAIRELSGKYHAYCYRIAWNFLYNREDCEECVNDTWFSAWRSIPPKRPPVLSYFLGKITRGFAIDRLRKRYAAKRTDLHMASLSRETERLDRLAGDFLEEEMDARELARILNRFLWGLSEEDRDIFLRRYWYLDKEKEIAKRHKRTVNGIKANLYRTRKKLYRVLQEEGRMPG